MSTHHPARLHSTPGLLGNGFTYTHVILHVAQAGPWLPGGGPSRARWVRSRIRWDDYPAHPRTAAT